MFRTTIALTGMAWVICGLAGVSQAEQAVDAKWIWFDEGNPAESAPAGKVWFRREIRAEEPSTGFAIVASDDEFTLWVNGRKIGSGAGQKSYRFNLSGIVERGTNVFAVEAVNKSGRAGLLVEAEIRGQSGRKIPCDTDAEWKAMKSAPPGEAWLAARFDDKSWKPVKVLGAHAETAWKEITFPTGDLDRFQVPEGFELKRVAGPDLVGSLIAITWGNRGRLIGSRERGAIINVIDSDSDGTYDQVTEYSAALKSSQGLCVVGDDLYAVGDGPEGPGLYRLPDANHDDVADEVILLVKQKGGIGEHGPHDVVLGPDGWLYHNLGNHAWITNTAEANTACRGWEEGYLLEPAYEDANGHAVGIKAPGGSIWRFTPDGKKWWAETVGFRNQYDIAFNQRGDLFTFDSDMEWDVNLPWYRPVRINHCIPGAEFGWRSGAKNWPEWYFDSLPGTIDVGRGSPTGVVFYEHSQFPEKYRGAMLNCDWSMGRIIVAYLKQDGVSYKGTFDNLVTGNPLNVSDIEVDRDGSVVFSTGGRGTEGGLYRVVYTGGAAKPAPASVKTVTEALALPQPQAAWNREAVAALKSQLSDNWLAEVTAKVKSGSPAEKVRALTLLSQHGPKPSEELLLGAATDADAGVRQFATLLLGDHSADATKATLTKLLADKDPLVQRRACEAFVRSGLTAPAEPVIKLLASKDRWLRFAARLTLERLPADQWKKQVLEHADIDVRLNGLLALYHLGTETLPTPEAIAAISKLFAQPLRDPRQQLDLRRMLQLVLVRGQVTDPESVKALSQLGEQLVKEFALLTAKDAGKVTPTPLARESAELIGWLNTPKAVETLLGAIEKSKGDFSTQTHYALCVRYAKGGWTLDHKRRLLDWYETTRDVEGGNSLQGFVRNIVTGSLERFSPEDRRQFILAWRERPHAARLVLSASQPEQVQGFDQVIGTLLAELEKQPGGGGQEMFALTIDVLSRSDSAESQALLRKLFDENADRRDLLARAIAKHPIPENVPALLRGVATGDKTTMQVCLQALASASFTPAKADEFRTVILAALKLGKEGGKAAVNVLKKWTGVEPPKDENIAVALAPYQQWFAEKYPDEPAPELSQVDADKTGYTLQQLLEFLDKPEAAKGDATRGRQIFAKANCVKCHKFLKEGEGVGPDLTTLRRRFQKKEIVEAILTPSQVISDQYAAVTVQTVDGLVHTGMPLPNPGSKNLLLLLQDATRIEVAPEKIEEQAKARTSVMPEGLLKELSLPEIADLFAFLETSKNNSEPAAPAAANAGGGK